MKVACITPVKHLGDLLDVFTSIENIDLKYIPYIGKNELRLLLKEEKIEYIFTNPNKQEFILDETILKNSNVRLINTASTGLNHIDLTFCQNNNIDVISLTKDYSLIRKLPSTAELAFTLLCALSKKIKNSVEAVYNFEWNYEKFIGRQLSGLTVGIVGYGRLGTFMSNYCKAFGMNVLIYDPYKRVFDYEQVELLELLELSDVISLHVHVASDTKNLINKATILNMKNAPILINTSRGEIVNESDVIYGLDNGLLSGYGADVICDEFGNIKNSKLINYARNNTDKVIITPHIGGMTYEGQYMAYKHAILKFENFND
jgi:D-3-phosphoglycerate dehydrogenase / 2-oxoglutarate reductase